MRPYYEAGGITIFHGDCRDVLPWMHADVLVTDPPYGRSYTTNREVRGVAASWRGQRITGDDSTDLRDEVLDWWIDRPALVFGNWRNQRPRGVRQILIWDKGPASGMGDLSIPWKPSFEEVYVIGSGFTGPRDEGVIKGYTIVTWESAGRSHPTEKPVALLKHLIGKCPPGDVLDPFMGSGTTLRAAKDLGRRAIGIEIEERYCEIAVKRLQQQSMIFDTPAPPPAEQSAFEFAAS